MRAGASSGRHAGLVRELRAIAVLFLCGSFGTSQGAGLDRRARFPLRFAALFLVFGHQRSFCFRPFANPPALIEDDVVRPGLLTSTCVENKSPLGDAALIEAGRRLRACQRNVCPRRLGTRSLAKNGVLSGLVWVASLVIGEVC